MSNNLIVGMPTIERFTVGDCEMLLRPLGSWVHIEDISKLIAWISEDDNRDLMLEKLKHIESVL